MGFKYLKKFNESSEYYTNQKYAIVYDVDSGFENCYLYDRYGNFIKKYKLEEFIESEREKIDNIMLSKFRARRYDNPWHSLPMDYNYLENFRYHLCKSEDEWYFLSVVDIKNNLWYYYKCDQFEGLIKLLDDLPNI